MLTLNGLSTPAQQQHFISHYWQKQHCFLKAALPSFQDPVSADELAGLACEDTVASRIVSGLRKTVEHGPFSEKRLQAFESADATLLVQAVEQYVPELLELRNAFGFIPSWRFEDVMVSFAVPGGGVGPHFDHYDVFLVQGQGSREWRVGQQCDEHSLIDAGSGQRILKEFTQQAAVTMQQGDVLYIPPGLAHWGVSNDNSLCYSIGFRAPSANELAGEWAHLLADDWRRYQDPQTWAVDQSMHQITPSAVHQAKTLLEALLSDESLIADALGIFQSTNFDDGTDIEPPSWAELEAYLAGGAELRRFPGARSFFYHDDRSTSAYFNGHALPVSGISIEWLEWICAANIVVHNDIKSHCSHKDDRISALNRTLLLSALQHRVYELRQQQ